jgi:hypothetical protein
VLTDQQIARMRATVDRTFPDEIVVKRLSKEYVDGGYAEDWNAVATIPARIGLPLGGETDERATSKVRLADEHLYTVWMQAETDVRITDRIEWEGREFEVIVVLERGNWELTRRIRMKEL